MSRNRLFAFVGMALAAMAIATSAMAHQGRGRGRDGDHDEARAAVEAREALPLTRILEIARRAVPGEIVEVELEREHGQLIYEVEVLTRTGRVRKVEIDARSGRVLDVEDED